jgi:hypothetical protein
VTWKKVRETELWRTTSSAVVALGLWRLLDILAEWLVAGVIRDYPGFAASDGMRWLLVTVFGLFAVAFVVALAEIAGRRVALLVGAALLGVNAFQAVAALAWRLGSTVAPGGDLLGLTQYAGEAAALALGLLVLLMVPGLTGDADAG